ncbi:MAG TPA: DUF559 domain-containing protein [Rhodothermales bacterium]|nr:DUF559 domain-containing protein [Rhodothermales bacterium]
MNHRPKHLLNQKRTKERRVALRSRATPAEAALWKMLSQRKLDGRKFRRQQSIGSYIVDFYCPSEGLVIELDGETHNDPFRHAYDSDRQQYLGGLGYKVLRFENRAVFEQPDFVLEAIREQFGGDLNNTEPPPTPP